MAKEAMVFFVTPDEHLSDTFDLITRWGLEYQTQIIYGGQDKFVGVFSSIEHISLVIATRGVVPGPKKGKESSTFMMVKGDPTSAMFKLVDEYAGDGKKIDMRKNGPAKGWDGVAK